MHKKANEKGRAKTVTEIAEEEDARLVREEKIRNSNLDYADISKKLLLHCNEYR